ncbi:MAG TPA: hypothetical protein VH206_09640 [Xanthobacteraceae bacterium]|nr:hypothetical protein [Xanthobacteraceae bacterium]
MSFELTINRVGAFAGTTSRAEELAPEALEAKFQERLDFVAGSECFREASRRIVGRAPHFREVTTDSELKHIRIRRVSLSDVDKSDWTLVGTLPGLKFECTTMGKKPRSQRDWIVRARASVTACALQNGKRNTKLWWTFEGVPSNDDPNNRPSAADITAFISLTDRMADAATRPLFGAYRSAIKQDASVDLSDFALRKNKIRIRMSDSNDYQVEALLDAIHYEGVDVSDIREQPERAAALQGLEMFEKFVSDVTKLNVHIPDESLRVEAKFDGFKGIFYRIIDDEKDTIVAGFGQQSGSITGLEYAVAPEKRRLQKQEEHLRAMSASRPISALLADKEASLLEPV